MLVITSLRHNATKLACRSIGLHLRRFVHASSTDAYKRVRLCDKPTYSLCRKSAELMQQGSGFAILLDGCVLESPFGNIISTGSLPLAERILGEWRSQLGQPTRFETVPTTMLLAETIDIESSKRSEIQESLVNAVAFDTALRFDMQPVVDLPPLEELDEHSLSQIAKLDIDVLQSSYLMPILLSFSQRRGVSPLVTSGDVVTYPRQKKDVLNHIQKSIYELKDAQVITLWKLHRTLKSVILPLELLDGAVSVPRALRAARLEETLQAANWGVSDDLRDLERSIQRLVSASLFFQRSYLDSSRR